MATREDKVETQVKTKFMVLTGPRGRRHGMPLRATWVNTRVVQRQKTRMRAEWKPWPSLGFHQKDDAGNGGQFVIG